MAARACSMRWLVCRSDTFGAGAYREATALTITHANRPAHRAVRWWIYGVASNLPHAPAWLRHCLDGTTTVYTPCTHHVHPMWIAIHMGCTWCVQGMYAVVAPSQHCHSQAGVWGIFGAALGTPRPASESAGHAKPKPCLSGLHPKPPPEVVVLPSRTPSVAVFGCKPDRQGRQPSYLGSTLVVPC